MRPEERRGALDGVLFGWMAGVFMLFAQMAWSILDGDPPWSPLHQFKSAIIGDQTLTTAAERGWVVIGFLIHSVLSALFGAVYGALNNKLPIDWHRSWSAQVGAGFLYGAVLWLINIQVLARIFWPAFLHTPQLPQLLIHALTFGVPLGLMYCGAERRVFPRPPVRA